MKADCGQQAARQQNEMGSSRVSVCVCVSASDSLRQLTSSHRLPQVRRGLHHSRHLGQARYGSRFSAQAQDAGTGYRALGLGSQSEEFLHPPQNLLVTFSDCPQPLRLSASLTSSRKLFRIGPSLSLGLSQLGAEWSQHHFSHSDRSYWGPALTLSPWHSQAAG